MSSSNLLKKISGLRKAKYLNITENIVLSLNIRKTKIDKQIRF